eukprot:1156978-Pelagomonas_calceolata.AAC.6
MPDCQVSSCVIGGGQKNDKVSVLQSCESVIKIDLIWLALCRKRPMQICMCCACWRVFSVSVASCIWKGFFTHTLREHCNTGVRPHQAFLPESALLRLVSGSKAFAVLQTCSLFVDVRAHTGARSAPEEVLRGQELHAGLQAKMHKASVKTSDCKHVTLCLCMRCIFAGLHPARSWMKTRYPLVCPLTCRWMAVRAMRRFCASPASKQMGKGRSKLAEKHDDGVVRQMCMGGPQNPY